jgi:hypothetical protein
LSEMSRRGSCGSSCGCSAPLLCFSSMGLTWPDHSFVVSLEVGWCQTSDSVLLAFAFFRNENWDSKKLSNLIKVTQ